MNALKMWIKNGDTPVSRALFSIASRILNIEVPCVPLLHSSVYLLHRSGSNALATIGRVLYWTPLFKSRLKAYGKNLYVYSGMPLLLGSIDITIGDNTRISGVTTFCGRTAGKETPELRIGKNVDIGWQNTLAVGRRIIIGDNVRLAGRVFLAGYPGHPLNAQDRANGLPDTESQVGDIILEDDVWLATGVTVLAGVTIGKGTIVAAGSVVSTDLPAGVLAGGMPAKVIKNLVRSYSNSEYLDSTLEGVKL